MRTQLTSHVATSFPMTRLGFVSAENCPFPSWFGSRFVRNRQHKLAAILLAARGKRKTTTYTGSLLFLFGLPSTHHPQLLSFLIPFDTSTSDFGLTEAFHDFLRVFRVSFSGAPNFLAPRWAQSHGASSQAPGKCSQAGEQRRGLELLPHEAWLRAPESH